MLVWLLRNVGLGEEVDELLVLVLDECWVLVGAVEMAEVDDLDCGGISTRKIFPSTSKGRKGEKGRTEVVETVMSGQNKKEREKKGGLLVWGVRALS